MIRCCSKFFIPLQTNSAGTICLSRIYVSSSSIDLTQKRRYASGENQPPRRFRKLFYTTVGLTLVGVGVGGVVVYAKSDPKFRKVLDSYVPGSDRFIRIVYQEEGSFSVELTEKIDKVLSIPTDFYKQVTGTATEGTTSPAIQTAKELKSGEPPKPKPRHAINTSGKQISPTEVVFGAQSIAEEAKKIYEEITSTIKEKADEVIDLIEKMEDHVDPKKAWKEIRDKVEDLGKVHEELGKKFEEAEEKFKKFQSFVKKLPESMAAELKEIEESLINMKNEAEHYKNNKLEASRKFLAKVEESVRKSGEELATLFPKYIPGSKVIKLTEDELDLFMYYAFHKILYLQKELDKMDTAIKHKIDKLFKSKDDANKLAEAVDVKVQEEKRKMKEDFDKKMLEMKKGCDEDVNSTLKRQEQIHLDILNEKLAQKEREVERKLAKQLDDKLLEEQSKLQAELADMCGRMKGLNEAIAKRALQDQKAQTSQALWSAAQALYDSCKHGDGDVKPLKEDIDAIKNASAKGDDLVETVLATIPKVAIERGVYPEDVLKERFVKVEDVAWKVAGVPEGGASLPKLLVAWLQSMLVLKASEPVPSSEANNEPFDPKSLNNYDILQRARYYIDRGDFEQALKYMNLLKGGARAVSSDWIKEAIVLLETEQAAHLLLAHAAASGMIYS